MNTLEAPSTHLRELQAAGFAMLPRTVDDETLVSLRHEAARFAEREPGQAHGVRGLLQRSGLIADWACSPAILKLLPSDMRPVRGILFDKTPGANWKVAWHQDLTIAVEERQELSGYGPWSMKDGTWHVQPPTDVLEGMVTLRLHLDDAPADNGALRVQPASHTRGRFTAEDIARLRGSVPGHVCEARAGDLLLMKPLILHASSPSAQPGHRRVVHVEYARNGLLHPRLRWACW